MREGELQNGFNEQNMIRLQMWDLYIFRILQSWYKNFAFCRKFSVQKKTQYCEYVQIYTHSHNQHSIHWTFFCCKLTIDLSTILVNSTEMRLKLSYDFLNSISKKQPLKLILQISGLNKLAGLRGKKLFFSSVKWYFEHIKQ